MQNAFSVDPAVVAFGPLQSKEEEKTALTVDSAVVASGPVEDKEEENTKVCPLASSLVALANIMNRSSR
jgi:hypothetical protein